MSVETIRSVVTRFLSNADPGVLVIKGAWGVGKTHTWDDLLKQNKDSIKLPQYVYVSLFGLKSISDLRTALVAKAIPTKYIGVDFSWDKVNREWTDLILPTGKWLAARAKGILPAIPHVKDISIPFDSIAKYLLGTAIICLDDWERTGIDPQELLGLVSELKVERKCKVVLIFNDSKLTDAQKAQYRDYREKVVDVELTFSPNPKEAVDIAISSASQHADLLKDKILRLGINNIRLISKILTLTKVLEEHVGQCRPQLRDQVITTCVLMAWVHFGEQCDRKPSIEFLRKWNALGSAIRERRGEPEDPRHQNWTAVLNGYGYLHTDELDLAIDKVIEHGYAEGSNLASELKSRNDALAANEVEQSFVQAWELFHGSFSNNEKELIDALSKGVRTSVKYVSPVNLSSTISLLRQLDRGDLADELIQFYVQNRADEKGLFDLEHNPFGSEVSDQKLREAFAKANSTHVNRPSLFDAVTGAAKNKGWSREDGEVIKDATADEIYALIMADGGTKRGSEFLESANWLASVNGLQDFRTKLSEALVKIAGTSRLNAARVRRFGVRLPE